MDLKESIKEHKIIVICRRLYGDPLLRLAEALYQGGIRFLEITFDQADPDAVEKSGKAILSLSSELPDMSIGSGTVLTVDQVQSAYEAGARYIISPNSDVEVIKKTKSLGLCSIPGAMTPSEILTAHYAGADLVKLFPAGSLGFGYIKDILAPISHVPLVATGGVTEENLSRYLELGFAGAGISGRLTDKELIASNNFQELTRRARVFCGIVKEYSR